MAITIYGIKNCDTIKKARSWLEAHGVAHAFHDYKAGGVDRASLEPDADKHGLDAQKAIALMLAQPAMIKRPVLDLGEGATIVGFKPEIYAGGIKPAAA